MSTLVYSYNKEKGNLYYPQYRSARTVRRRCGSAAKPSLISNAFFMVMLTFIIFAAIQTAQLNRLASDTKAIGENINDLCTQETILYNSNSGLKSLT